jgi:stage V sporulation protein G
MEISSIKIRRIEGDRHLKAVVSVVFDAAFAVHDMKIIAGQDRLFLAMPSKKLADGSFRDIAHPIHVEMREELERRVLEEYAREAADENP